MRSEIADEVVESKAYRDARALADIAGCTAELVDSVDELESDCVSASDNSVADPSTNGILGSTRKWYFAMKRSQLCTACEVLLLTFWKLVKDRHRVRVM